MVSTEHRSECSRQRLVMALFLITFPLGLQAEETALMQFKPDRVVRGTRFTLRIETSLPWSDDVEIIPPELAEPLVWWSYPYAQRWIPDEGSPLPRTVVLAAIRVDAPGFHTVDPFRIRSGELEATTPPKEIIGLAQDESEFPFPVVSAWRIVPETAWQGQAVPVVLEARNLSSIILADSTVLESAPQGILESAPSLGIISRRPHGSTMLYDLPAGSWMWTFSESGRHVFPRVRASLGGLNRVGPAFAVDVLPLPEPVRSSGAVGRFRVSVLWDSEIHRVGDVVTVRVRVEGEGNLNVLNLPVPELEGGMVVGSFSSSSYVPGFEGYRGWREESHNFQIREEGNLRLNVPPWQWLEPTDRGQIREFTAETAWIRAEGALGGRESEWAAMLLGGDLFRYGPSRFHGGYWIFLAAPGFCVLTIMVLRRRFGGIVGLMAIPLFLSASGMGGSASAAKAVDAASSGDWNTARLIYQNLENSMENHPGLLHDLSLVEMEAGRADMAVANIRRALHLRPGSRRLQATLGIIEEGLGLDDQAPVPLRWPPSFVFALWLLSANILFAALTRLLKRREANEVIMLITAIFFFTISSAAWLVTDNLWKRPTAVVRGDAQPLKRIPGPLASDWIRLPPGSAVRVSAVEEEHCLIRTAHGLEGWLPLKSLRLIAEVSDGL